MGDDGQRKKKPTGREAPPWEKPALRRARDTTDGRELDLAWAASQACLARCCEAVADELEAAVAVLRARARR